VFGVSAGFPDACARAARDVSASSFSSALIEGAAIDSVTTSFGGSAWFHGAAKLARGERAYHRAFGGGAGRSAQGTKDFPDFLDQRRLRFGARDLLVDGLFLEPVAQDFEMKKASPPLLFISLEMDVGRAQLRHRNLGGVCAHDQVADHVIGFNGSAGLDVAEH
jgi:hypothetical protein